MKLSVILTLFCLSYLSLTNTSGTVDLEEYGCSGTRTQLESYQEPYTCSYIYRGWTFTTILYKTCYRTLYRESRVTTIKLSNCPSSCGGCSGSNAISSPTCPGQRWVSYQEAYSCTTGWYYRNTCYRTMYKYVTSHICCPGSSIVNENFCQRVIDAECGQNKYGISTLSLASDYVLAVIGGSDARPGQFPWQVRLNITTPSGSSTCGGSIIAQRWILTAAHCVRESTNGTVYIGDHKRNVTESTEVRLAFTRVILHPSYTPSPYVVNHDIALIKISPITFTPDVRPVCLPANARNYTGKPVTISGWGLDGSGMPANVLQYTRAQVVRNSSCDPLGVRENEICALDQGRSTSCLGDSGGPMIFVENERAYQIGVSWYVANKTCPITESFAYTDVGPYLAWIRSTILL